MSAGTYIPSLITANTLRVWLEADTQSYPFPRINEALRWAHEVWQHADRSAAQATEGALEPDRLYALVRTVSEDTAGDPRRIEDWYDLVAQAKWPSREFDERIDLLSSLAYVLSRQYRRTGEPKLSWSWERKTAQLAQQLPSVAEFLALDENERTDQLRNRFLSDPRVLIALCAGLYQKTNLNPSESIREVIATYRYVLQSSALDIQAEERAWFLVQLEILMALSYRFCGDFPSSQRWLDLAAGRCHSVAGADIPLARIELIRRSSDYDRRDFEGARVGLSHLADRFELFGMQRLALLTKYLDGVALKELGRFAEALPQLYAVASTESSDVEGWVKGLALMYIAEIMARSGEPGKAFETLSKARTVMGVSRAPLAVGHFHAVKAQILRDLGNLESAIESYRLAAETYGAAGYRSLETLLRIILAETLLAAGHDNEAFPEIVIALRISETLSLVQEGAVAIALLRESLTRQSPDREALLSLRRTLQSLSEGIRS